MTERRPVVVVGGGITGLALGRALERRDVGSLVLEAAGRPGGVIRSIRTEGRVLEMGPQRVRLVPPVARLVRELGLEERILRAREGLPLFVLVSGRLRRAPLTLRGLLRTDLLSWRGKLRLLAEPLAGPPRAGETVADYFTRTLGAEAYRRWAGPLYGGIYGSDPARMPVEGALRPALERLGVGRSLLAAFLRWRIRGGETPPAATFPEGLQELPDALYREGRARIRLEAAAVRVRPADRRAAPDGDGDLLPRWTVETAAGAVEARDVVLACPADEAARLLGGSLPGVAARLERLRYNPLAVVHLLTGDGMDGYGYQVALDERTATRGVTFNHGLFGPGHGEDPVSVEEGRRARAGVHTAYLGGAARPEVAEWPDDEVGRVAREEFRRATGREARVLRVGRTRMPAWDESWSALEGLEVPPGLHLCGPHVSRPGIPGRIWEAEEKARELAGEG